MASAADGTSVVHVEPVMGTMVSFAVFAEHAEHAEHATAPATIGQLVAEACQVLHRLDGIFSTWKPESPMSRLRRGDLSSEDAPDEVREVLAECADAKRASRGWFDPWALPGGVDPTGLVKGWALERAMAVLRRGGIGSALINAGGDVAILGEPSPGKGWRIGIRHPWRARALAGVVEVKGAIATSGTYERGAHLFDPFSGRLMARAASATVTGPDLAMADALATALAVGGDHVLPGIAAMEEYEAYLVRMDGSEARTSQLRFVE